jgi:hypothetical protein
MLSSFPQYMGRLCTIPLFNLEKQLTPSFFVNLGLAPSFTNILNVRLTHHDYSSNDF